MFQLTVCPKIRAQLGVMWKRSTTKCTCPSHTGKAKADRSVSPVMSYYLLVHKGVLVPVGSGICRRCRGELYEAMKVENMLNIKIPMDTRDTASITSTCSASQELQDSCHEIKNFASHSAMTCNQEQSDLQSELLSDEESFHDSQSLSQVSSWSEENMDCGLRDLNKAIDILGHGKTSPLKFRVTRDISSLQPSTARLLKRKATETVNLVLDAIAPGQASKLQKIIQEPDQSEGTSMPQNLLQVVINLYIESTDRHTKKQLLSMIANSYTKKELLHLIPGVTVHGINEARKHAAEHAAGANIPMQKPVFHHKMDQAKLDHALDFFFNPAFHQITSFGTKIMKLEDGSFVTIPEVVRTVWHSTLIKVYQSYCKDTDFVPLSRSTLFYILSVCPASKRTNLRGLDNVAADGGNSYDLLLSTIADMEKYATDGLRQMELKECKEALMESRIYMKTDYKVHLKQGSNINKSQLYYFETALPSITKEDILNDISAAETKITEWKSHIVRCINQDYARIHQLQELQFGDVLLIMDWAMKFLPIAFREKQSDWYGQKGVNWHVIVCIFKDETLNLKHRTFVHLIDSIKQDWIAVASILESTLTEIKEQLPDVRRAVLRSDNAGCYH
ncbi:uncharacterized protein LOC133193145 [Saccostrea echinata]|uniref:uncharacterized protein LOC133193145 n=1 Tax=Saccostrea echinata TaxID=191078 RepID=UPI002A830AD3|nr:uncharacterized protein LOC133193145 [Saccostrea echinata]